MQSRLSCYLLVRPLAVCLALSLYASMVHADDWPQWRGPSRLGVWTETGIVNRFPDAGLKVAWRVPIRPGFAGPVVAAGRVFVLDYREIRGTRTKDGAERLLCLEEETGELLWTQEWPATYRNLHVTFAIGPRATPSVDGDRIYVVGAAGMILSLETATGAVVWQVDTVAEYGTTVPVYGVSSAPLVDGDTTALVSGGVGLRLRRHLGLDVELFYAADLGLPTDVDIIIQTLGAAFAPVERVERSRLISFLTKMTVEFHVANGRVWPYLTGGGGVGSLRQTVTFRNLPVPLADALGVQICPPPMFDDTATELALTIGGGVDVRVWKELAIGGDVRYLRLLDDTEGFDFAFVTSRVSYRF